MRKFLYVIFFITFAINGNAQVYIGGEISFWDNNDDHETTISVIPEVGYRVSKRFAAGAKAGYGYSKVKGVHTDSYIIEPYLRHIPYSKNGFEIYWDGTLELSFIDPSNARSGYCLGIGAKPGIGYIINGHFGITANLGFIGYRHCERNFKHPKYKPGLGFSFLNDLSFSLYYHF